MGVSVRVRVRVCVCVCACACELWLICCEKYKTSSLFVLQMRVFGLGNACLLFWKCVSFCTSHQVCLYFSLSLFALLIKSFCDHSYTFFLVHSVTYLHASWYIYTNESCFVHECVVFLTYKLVLTYK